jgi:hypothetical protein
MPNPRPMRVSSALDFIVVLRTSVYLTPSPFLPAGAEEVLDALLRMSATSDIASSLVASLALFSSCLHSFMEEPSVVEVLLALLKNVCKQDGSGVTFCTPRNVALIVQAMTEHEEGEETLMEMGCLLVEVLAKGNAEGAKALIEGGIEDRLNKASTVITNVRNQKYVVAAQAALQG